MNRLRECRKQKKLLQKDVANFLSVAVSTYSYWENGIYDIDNVSLHKLADYFNVSIDYLLGRTEETIVIPHELNGVRVGFSLPNELTQDDIDDVQNYVEFVRQRRLQKKDK